MASMSDDWRTKDDLDLTSDDITQMFDAGEPVDVGGPEHTPAYARLVSTNCTFAGGGRYATITSWVVPRLESGHL